MKRGSKRTPVQQAAVDKINHIMKHAAKPTKQVLALPGSRQLATALEGFNKSVDQLTRIAVDIGIKTAVRQLNAVGRKIAKAK
jgi:hypothetical protein